MDGHSFFWEEPQKGDMRGYNLRGENGLLNEPTNRIHKLSGFTFNPLT